MGGTCHTFVKTHQGVQHRTKGEPTCQLRTLCDNDGGVGSSLVINVPAGGDVDSGGEAGWRQGVYGTLYAFRSILL